MTIEEDWAELTGSLAGAGARMSELTAGLGPVEAADGHRALLRALNNQLGRLEVDRERPELVPFNGWREKFFMDNPDFRYWVADVRHDRRYRISGTLGDAVFQSITAYATRGGPARSVGRIASDSIGVDDDGRFTVVRRLSRRSPGTGSSRGRRHDLGPPLPRRCRSGPPRGRHVGRSTNRTSRRRSSRGAGLHPTPGPRWPPFPR